MSIFRRRTAERYLRPVRSHFDRAVATGTARGYGGGDCGMWMSSLDVHTGRYPADDSRRGPAGDRICRNIHAPRGCTFYWDQPLIVAACALSEQTGDPRHAAAADRYVRDVLERCVAHTGLLLWGNHYYYDAFRGKVMRFVSSEPPTACDPAVEDGSLHELRPIPPAWELLWRGSPEATERHIRQMADRHVYDPAGGGFNRHADRKRARAVLEAGGILVEAISFLAAHTGDDELRQAARRVAAFSWHHRDDRTGLLENDPTSDRWDKRICTTEVGLWAGCLLRAARMTGDDDLQTMAYGAVTAYLRHGFDEAEGRYFGRLNVADGSPDRSRKTTVYQPDTYSDPWQPLLRTHDYPVQLAQCCLRLYELTGDGACRTAVERWAEIVRETFPDPAAGDARPVYAEHLGRAVWLLLDAADAFRQPDLRRHATELADRALELLYCDGMFRTHTGEDRADAVDGLGFLLLALLYLARRRKPPTYGLGL